MSVNCGIYSIQCLENNKRYIGSAVNIKRRWYKHRYELARNIHHNHPLQDDYNKFGENSFVFSIIEVCDRGELIQKEHDYVNKYNCLNNNFGYNLIDPFECRDFSKPIKYLTDEEIGIAKILLCIGLSYTTASRLCDVGFYTLKGIKTLEMFRDKSCQYNKYLIDTSIKPNLIDLIGDLQKLNYDLSKLFNKNIWKLISPIPSPIFCNYCQLDLKQKEYDDIKKSLTKIKSIKTTIDNNKIMRLEKVSTTTNTKKTTAIKKAMKKPTTTMKEAKKKNNCRKHCNLTNIKNPYRNEQGQWHERFID